MSVVYWSYGLWIIFAIIFFALFSVYVNAVVRKDIEPTSDSSKTFSWILIAIGSIFVLIPAVIFMVFEIMRFIKYRKQEKYTSETSDTLENYEKLKRPKNLEIEDSFFEESSEDSSEPEYELRKEIRKTKFGY